MSEGRAHILPPLASYNKLRLYHNGCSGSPATSRGEFLGVIVVLVSPWCLPGICWCLLGAFQVGFLPDATRYAPDLPRLHIIYQIPNNHFLGFLPDVSELLLRPGDEISLDNRDNAQCVVCGYDLKECFAHCHIIGKKHFRQCRPMGDPQEKWLYPRPCKVAHP